MPLRIRRVLEESTSIAAILVGWALLSIFAVGNGTVQFAILFGGLIMAALYAVVRGTALSTEATPAYEDTDPEGVLRENGRAALAAVPWFVLAIVTAFLTQQLPYFGLTLFSQRGLLWTLFGQLGQAFAFTGVFAVLLVAVASGTRAVRAGRYRDVHSSSE